MGQLEDFVDTFECHFQTYIFSSLSMYKHKSSSHGAFLCLEGHDIDLEEPLLYDCHDIIE